MITFVHTGRMKWFFMVRAARVSHHASCIVDAGACLSVCSNRMLNDMGAIRASDFSRPSLCQRYSLPLITQFSSSIPSPRSTELYNSGIAIWCHSRHTRAAFATVGSAQQSFRTMRRSSGGKRVIGPGRAAEEYAGGSVVWAHQIRCLRRMDWYASYFLI